MSQRARQMGKLWGLLAATLLLLHVLLFLGWIFIGIDTYPALTLVAIVTILYVVLLAAIVLVFCKQVNRAADPIVYREARAYGLPATANVLRIERTRWRVRRNLNFCLRLRPQRFEYQMRLRVTRAGAADYEADMAEYLVGDDVPARGDLIAVKVHPNHPHVIVMSRNIGPKPFASSDPKRL